MQINLDYITYEVFDSDCYVFRYYDKENMNILYKTQYIFYTINEAKELFIQELNNIFL
jgi:hypothetical protein